MKLRLRPPRLPRGRVRLRPRNRLAIRLIALLAFVGPGLVAANAGNDAGGIATYASVGAKYGYDLLWMMVLITISLIVVQEMAARMGAVTGKGLAELIREQYGPRWSLFSTCAVLFANLGICISEFVGVGAALGLAGVPPQISVPIAAAVIWLLVVRGSYKLAERVFVAMTLVFFAYPIAAILAHPHWGSVGRAVVEPKIHLTSTYIILFVATVGTTITPFMQLYLQSAVVERGMGPEDIPAERAEVTLASIFANLVAVFIIIATGATLYVHGDHSGLERGAGGEGARAVRGPLRRAAVRHRTARREPARGGDPPRHGRLRDRRDVRPREGNRATAARGAGVRDDADRAPARRRGGGDDPGPARVQAARVRPGPERRALPVTLFFLWRLARNEELMGEYRNGRVFDAIAAVTVVATSGLSLVLVGLTVAGKA